MALRVSGHFNFIIFLIIICIPSLCSALTLTVDLQGLTINIKEFIKADLSIQKAINEPKLTPSRIENLYRISEKEIQSTLESLGYYHSKISASLDHQDTNWNAKFSIDLGKPTILTKVSINIISQGKPNTQLQNNISASKFVIGQPILHDDYEKTKETLLSKIKEQGYLDALFVENILEINKDDYTAHVRLILETGQSYVFGKVTFENALYSDSLLNRFIPFELGTPYTLEQMLQFRKNLEDSDLFKKVRLDPKPNQVIGDNDYDIPINVRLIPKPRNRYTGSIGYGTDTGARGGLGWQHRRIIQPGHKFAIGFNASQIRRQLNMNYVIPGKQAANDRYVLGSTIQEEITQEKYSRKTEMSTIKVKKRGNLQSTYGINYFNEIFRFISNDPKKRRSFLLPNAHWIWLDPKETENYRRGTRFELLLRGGLQSALSATNLIQMEMTAKHITPISTNDRLLIRGTLGAISAKRFRELPPSLRFFSGGDQTVRGFRYNSLAPKEFDSELGRAVPVGGKYLAIANIELEHQLFESFSAAAFTDAGNAFNTLHEPLGIGIGTGIRWHTPIGVFRVDIAKPLNQSENKHWRLHLTFGTDL